MIRFNCLGVPVAIHWMFWILAAFVSGAFHAMGRDAWALVVARMGVVAVSILVHEMGHALMQRKFGGRPAIMLHGFGGYSTAPGRFARNENLKIIAMGPIASVALALLGWIWWKSYHPDVDWSLLRGMLSPVFLARVAGFVIFVNVFWTLLNLLPILPLDGGRLLEHVMHGRNPVLRYQIAMVTAAAVAFVLLFAWGSLFGGFVFGFMAYENFNRSRGRDVPGIFGRF